jgi:septal ring factor EnvC (AmiA/AmiB activator)
MTMRRYAVANQTTDDVPEVIPWDRFQKEAERGLDISVYIASMNAHILNQRDALARQTKQLEQLRLDLAQQALNGQTVIEQQKEIERLEKLATQYQRDNSALISRLARHESVPDVGDKP